MNVLFLTAHDFRTPRKVSLHFIAERLAAAGNPVRFFSLRYSWLSTRRPDGRHCIAERANREEQVNGVDCFLWKTLLHPFNTRIPLLRRVEGWLYDLYVALAPRLLRHWISEADVIVLESGIAPVFYDLAQRLNPRSRIIYVAADELDAIDVAWHVKRTLWRISPRLDYAVVNSPRMVRDFAPGTRRYFVPHGIDSETAQLGDPSPYQGGCNVVSVGSMLFDGNVFTQAATAHPEVTFHVIGCGQPRPGEWPANVRHYDEMPFTQTLAYIKHADAGVAPYLPTQIPASLADTSMKLQQYAFFGVPAICPQQVVGGYAHRFGYQADDPASIKAAVGQALAAGHHSGLPVLDWQQITDRYFNPSAFADTELPAVPARPDSHAYFFVETQFDNLGDALLNRELIRLMSQHADVTLGLSKVPDHFIDMLGRSFLDGFAQDRTHGRSRFLLGIAWRRILGEQSYLFLSPGGWIGDLDGRLNLRSWLHTGLYYLLAGLGVRICQLGVSYEDLGPKLKLQLKARSAAMFRHLVRDTLSEQTLATLSVRSDGRAPDLAFNAFLAEAPVSVNGITFSFRSDQYPEQGEEARLVVERILALLGTEQPVYFVYQVEKDRAINEQLASWVRERIGIPCQADDGCQRIADTQALYRRSARVVSNRLHSLLLAGSVGNRMLAAPIGVHNKKITALFQDIGLGACVCSAARVANLSRDELLAMAASAPALGEQKAQLERQVADLFALHQEGR